MSGLPSKTLLDARPTRWARWWPFAMICGCGVLLSLGAAGWTRVRQATAVQQEMSRRAELLREVVRAELLEHGRMLHSLRMIFDYSEKVEAEEFLQAAADLRSRYRAAQALEWLPRVTHAERAEFEAAMQQRYPEFEIRDREGLRTMVRAPARPAYYPVSFVEPLVGNRYALGFDLAGGRSWPIMERSQFDGEMRASGRLPLLDEEEGESWGYILHLPVVTRAWATLPATERPGAVRGFVFAVFRIAALMQTATVYQRTNHLDLLVLDVNGGIAPGDAASPAPVLLHYEAADPLAPRPRDDELTPAHFARAPWHSVQTVTFGGRTWELWCRPDAAWLRAQESLAPWGVLGAGLVLTLLAAGLVHTSRERTRAIAHEVAERTAQLRTSRAEFVAILEHSPSAIFVKDLAGRYVVVNRKFAEQLGLPREAILGHTTVELFPGAEASRLAEWDARVWEERRAFEVEQTFEHGGRPRTVLLSLFPLTADDNTIRGICGIALDITDRQRAETERRTVERRLLETQKLESLGVLAGGIAHDFNNLLTGILGNVTLLAHDLAPALRGHESLHAIENAAQRAAELCRQMLAYSGKGRFVVEPTDLNHLIQDTVPLLRHSISKQARLHLALSADLPLVVVDATQVRQVVMNLVINAAEALGENLGDIHLATASGPVLPESWRRAAVRPELAAERYAWIEVRDTGSGMPPETLARIFDPFFTTKFAGRGLGLAAVLGIVRSHSGGLFVDSAPGVGTTFRVCLPLPTQAVEKPVRTDDGSRTPWRRAGHLLLVDDEDAVRDVGRRLLVALGLTVDVAADGQTALALFAERAGSYDLVMVDLTMPGMSGAEVVERVRALRPEQRVLMMSGYSEQEVRARPGAADAGFLQKPFTLASLKAVLGTLLPT